MLRLTSIDASLGASPAICGRNCGDNRTGNGRRILCLLDLYAELGLKVVLTFWGILYGWEVATGYPWGFWEGEDYRIRDLRKVLRDI